MNLLQIFCVVAMLYVLNGCDNRRPFQAHYTSADTVEVNYQGKTYALNRFGPRTATPFQYSFEGDGDLDLSIDGREYEVDSPYDRDRDTKSKKKKAKVKKKSKSFKQ